MLRRPPRWTHLSDFGPAGRPTGSGSARPVPSTDRARRPSPLGHVVSLGLGARDGGSASQYFVGDFDGKTFTAQEPDQVRWLDYGPDHYAAVSFSGLPTGEVVTIGWAGNWAYSGATPSDGSRGQMSVPRRLSLARDADDLRLVRTPVELPDIPAVTSLPHDGTSFIYEGVLGGSAPSALRVLASDTHWTEIGFDAATSSVYVDRTRSGAVDFHDAFRGRYSAPVPPLGTVQLQCASWSMPALSRCLPTAAGRRSAAWSFRTQTKPAPPSPKPGSTDVRSG